MSIGFSGRVNKGSGAAPDCQRPGRAPFVGGRRRPRGGPLRALSHCLSSFGFQDGPQRVDGVLKLDL